METLTDKDIDYLIEIGKLDFSAVNQAMPQIKYLKNRAIINTLDPLEWRTKIYPYSDSDLIYLFKGLVIAERELQWTGGSVASAIWVYKLIADRNLDTDKKIAEFAVKNSYNTHVPFGGSRVLFGWESAYADRHRVRIARQNSPNREHNLERNGREAGRKKIREWRTSNIRELSYDERKKIREELLKKYSSLSLLEKMEIIEKDTKYPPQFYPPEWVSVSYDEIKQLPIKLVKTLYDRLSYKPKGQWKQFAKYLKKYEDSFREIE